MCSSVSVFHISVQWSINVDQFMQTFDSELIKNSVKMVVIRCLILCSKFAKKWFVCRWGSLQRSLRAPNWVKGKGRGKVRWKGGERAGEKKGGE